MRYPHHLLACLLFGVVTDARASEPLTQELTARLQKTTEHTLDMASKLSRTKANRFCYEYADKLLQLAVRVAEAQGNPMAADAKGGCTCLWFDQLSLYQNIFRHLTNTS